MNNILVLDIASVMKRPAVAAVKAGPNHVEYYLYEVLQILAEIGHSNPLMSWQVRLSIIDDMLFPLLKPIEEHWRNKGRRVNAAITFNPLSGEPGILVLEPDTGSRRIIYGRKGDGYCIQQV